MTRKGTSVEPLLCPNLLTETEQLINGATKANAQLINNKMLANKMFSKST